MNRQKRSLYARRHSGGRNARGSEATSTWLHPASTIAAVRDMVWRRTTWQSSRSRSFMRLVAHGSDARREHEKHLDCDSKNCVPTPQFPTSPAPPTLPFFRNTAAGTSFTFFLNRAQARRARQPERRKTRCKRSDLTRQGATTPSRLGCLHRQASPQQSRLVDDPCVEEKKKARRA